MIGKRMTGFLLAVSVLVFILAGMAGCSKRSAEEHTGQDKEEAAGLIENYVIAYEKLHFRGMWKYWPPGAFGVKQDILAGMERDIFRNSYGKKARLRVEYGDIRKGSEEERKMILRYFQPEGINYVTDVWVTEYEATVDGGKKDGQLYKEGIICAFRNKGKWFAFDH